MPKWGNVELLVSPERLFDDSFDRISQSISGFMPNKNSGEKKTNKKSPITATFNGEVLC